VARLQDTFNFGDFENLDKESLLRLLQRMWSDLAVAINSKPDLYQRQTDGLVSDTFLAQGAININLATNKVEMLTNHPTQTTVTWVTLG
jgi:hypothetical protein